MRELSGALKETVSELLSMFGIECQLIEEVDEEKLRSCEQIDVIIGLAGEVKGNIVLGLTKNTTLRIVSGMMGGMEISELDEIALSGISEFVNMLGGSTVTKLQTDSFVDITPPTVIMSEGNTTVINQLKSHKLVYALGDEKMAISYCIKKLE